MKIKSILICWKFLDSQKDIDIDKDYWWHVFSFLQFKSCLSHCKKNFVCQWSRNELFAFAVGQENALSFCPAMWSKYPTQ